MNNDEYNAEMDKLQLQGEAIMNRFGCKILWAYQCIRCGQIFDDMRIATPHIMVCEGKKYELEKDCI